MAVILKINLAESSPRRSVISNSLISCSSTRVRRLGAVLMTFFSGQAISQGLAFCTTFLLVRWLPVHEYAVYGILASILQTTNQLANMGAAGAILPIGGAGGMPATSAAITAALRFRRLLIAVLMPAVVVYLVYIGQRQKLDWDILLVQAALIALSVNFDGWTACYQPALLLEGKLGRVYRAGNLSMVARVASIGLFQALGWLSGILAVATITLQSLLGGWWMRASARECGVEERRDPEIDRRVRSIVHREALGVIFFSFNSQITIFIVSFFGSTRTVAEVYALGRLGVLFSFFGIAYKTLVMPRLAKLSVREFRKTSAISLAGLGIVSFALVGFALLVPGWYRWVLGPAYSGLQTEAALVVVGGCLLMMGYAFSDAAAARAWIYHWSTMLRIALVVAAQVAGALTLDLSTTMGSVLFGLLGSTAIFVAHLIQWICGVWNSTRVARRIS